MSLLVWIPMTSDFNNQGISSHTVSNTGVTSYAQGKLGQCGYFTGEYNSYLQLDSALDSLFSGDFTFAVWLCPADSTRGVIIGEYGTTGSAAVNLELTAALELRFYWNGSPDILASSYYLPQNAWTHCVLVKTSNSVKIYANGELIKTYTGTLTNRTTTLGLRVGNDYRGGSNVAYKGYMNDLRVYNHALSEKEIKLLSQGLVAHYKLAEPLSSTDTTVYDCSGYNYHGTPTEVLTYGSDTPRYITSAHFNGTAYSYTPSISSEVKSISLWVKWDSIPSGQSVVFMDYKSRIGFGLMSTGILCGSVANTYKTFSKSNIVANTWYHFVIVNPGTVTGTDRKLYINGVEQTATTNTSVWTYALDYLQIGKRSTTSDGFVGNISDFRMYSTVLSDNDILELYHTGQSISKDKRLFAYDYNEPYNGELMNVRYTNGYGTHTESSPWTKINSNGEYYFDTNNSSAGSVYVPVNPTGKTYYYDMTLSINAGNQFYVGFERYDANKTPRSNNACAYVYTTKPTADVVHQRFRGTVDLSTDGVNPCAFVTLRILNGWSGTTSGVTGQATIHYLSLREIDDSAGFHTSFGKNGVATTDLLLEVNGTGDIEKTGIINMTGFYEI